MSKQFTRSFGNRQNFPPSTYTGPYTEDEVKELEQFAVDLKASDVDQKLINPWIRAKLGPYFREGWTDRVATRKIVQERIDRQSQRPGDSTHFTVKHAMAEAVGLDSSVSCCYRENKTPLTIDII